MGQTLHPPPPVALHGVATPLSRLIPQFCVWGVAATPPQKTPVAPLSLPPRGGVAGAWVLQNPVALQGVEQLHCSVSRYNLPLRLQRETRKRNVSERGIQSNIVRRHPRATTTTSAFMFGRLGCHTWSAFDMCLPFVLNRLQY